MKILLISDTHRRIAPVNELAAATGADCCFHLGDLCTYTRDSVSRFSAEVRERRGVTCERQADLLTVFEVAHDRPALAAPSP